MAASWNDGKAAVREAVAHEKKGDEWKYEAQTQANFRRDEGRATQARLAKAEKTLDDATEALQRLVDGTWNEGIDGIISSRTYIVSVLQELAALHEGEKP